MSLILEALKKSEFRRRLGEAPNLDTPFTPTRKRNNLLPGLLAAIAVAMALGWWLINRPVSTPTPTNAASPNKPAADAQPLTAIAPSSTATATSVDFNRNAQTKPNIHEPVAVARSSAADRTPSVAKTEAGLPMSAGQAQTNSGALIVPNPSLLKPPPKSAATAPAATKPDVAEHESEVPAADIASNDSEIARAAATSTANADPAVLALAGHETAAAPTTAPPPPMQPTRVPPPETNPVAASAQPANPIPPTAKPGGDALPLYFQLPYSLRKDLPTIKISMHVYAAEPTQRFTIINGTRQTEGSTVSTDLTLKEIRANELVLEFRGQRFIVPRSGT